MTSLEARLHCSPRRCRAETRVLRARGIATFVSDADDEDVEAERMASDLRIRARDASFLRRAEDLL